MASPCYTNSFKSIDEIPLPYQKVFAGYPCFNLVQSDVLDDVLHTDKSIVVSAPTGSGKTVIFELAIVRLLKQYGLGDVPTKEFKIVYISPIKSLCQERLVDWYGKFSEFGLKCVAVTGDSDDFDFSNLLSHNLIISTPEKWDSLSRKWRDNEKIVKVVKLFMIDEVHLLGEENRGSTLEVIVCRMKTVENLINQCNNGEYRQKIRFIALSATIPNVDDIAIWMGKRSDVKFFKFSEDVRPVKLKKIVLGYNYNQKTSAFKFDLTLNYKLESLLIQYSEGKPTLIFCSTRKSVEMTVKHLVQTLSIQLNQDQRQKLEQISESITDMKAKVGIRHGIGYHHAGLDPDTRRMVEDAFRGSHLPVLVTTSTLAMGVNLPAHLIIVKSTKCYDKGGFRDYTESAIAQMIGRAGRPQFDQSATAIILTTTQEKAKFEQMVGCNQPIESSLHRHLTEHLNAEIVLRTITDLDVAMQWLTSTFLYVRAKKNPRHYGLSLDFNQQKIDKKILEICQIDLNKLVSAGMVTMDENVAIKSTITGEIMARYYIAFETMKLFTQITGTEILIQMLALMSKCAEFSGVRLRVNDKKTLNLLNKNSSKNTIRFPLNGRIKTGDMKVNCIIQAIFGNLEIADHSILSESFIIMRNGTRIARCLLEYLSTRKANCYSALLNTIILNKCFNAKLWEDSPYVSKQLTGIGSVLSSLLVNGGKTTFDKILKSNPRDLEMIMKRRPPLGNQIIEEVQCIPRYKMTFVKTSEGSTCQRLKVEIVLENVKDLVSKCTVSAKSMMILLIGNNMNETILFEKYQHSYMVEHPHLVKFINLKTLTGLEEVEAHFISENWVGIDCSSKVYFDTKMVNKVTPSDQNDSKQPSYMQMFLDMYYKIKKPVKRNSIETSVKGDKEKNSIDEKKKKTRNNRQKNQTKKVNESTVNKNNEMADVMMMRNTIERVMENNKCIHYIEKYGDILSDIDQSETERQFPLEIPEMSKYNGINVLSTTDLSSPSHKYTGEEQQHDSERGTKTNLSPNLITIFEKYEGNMDHKKDSTELQSTKTNFQSEISNQTFSRKHQNTENAGTGKSNNNYNNSSMITDQRSVIINHRHETSRENSKEHGEINQYYVEKDGESSVTTNENRYDKTNMPSISPSFTISQSQEPPAPTEEIKNKTNSSEIIMNFNKIHYSDPTVQDISRNYLGTNFTEHTPINNLKRKAEENINDTNDKATKKQSLGQYMFPSKKKLTHQYEIENAPGVSIKYSITKDLDMMKRKQDNFDGETFPQDIEKVRDNQKSLKWRSPLVFSPAVKYSPNINFSGNSAKNQPIQSDALNDTQETSSSTKEAKYLTLNIQSTPKNSTEVKKPFKNTHKARGTVFPLSDKDYNISPVQNTRENEIDKMDTYSDICSNSILENISITKDKKNIQRKYKEHESSVTDYYSKLMPKNEPNKKMADSEKMPEPKNNENKENLPNNTQNMQAGVFGNSQCSYTHNSQKVQSSFLKQQLQTQNPNNRLFTQGAISRNPSQEFCDLRKLQNYRGFGSSQSGGDIYEDCDQKAYYFQNTEFDYENVTQNSTQYPGQCYEEVDNDGMRYIRPHLNMSKHFYGNGIIESRNVFGPIVPVIYSPAPHHQQYNILPRMPLADVHRSRYFPIMGQDNSYIPRRPLVRNPNYEDTVPNYGYMEEDMYQTRCEIPEIYPNLMQPHYEEKLSAPPRISTNQYKQQFPATQSRKLSIVANTQPFSNPQANIEEQSLNQSFITNTEYVPHSSTDMDPRHLRQSFRVNKQSFPKSQNELDPHNQSFLASTKPFPNPQNDIELHHSNQSLGNKQYFPKSQKIVDLHMNETLRASTKHFSNNQNHIDPHLNQSLIASPSTYSLPQNITDVHHFNRSYAVSQSRMPHNWEHYSTNPYYRNYETQPTRNFYNTNLPNSSSYAGDYPINRVMMSQSSYFQNSSDKEYVMNKFLQSLSDEEEF